MSAVNEPPIREDGLPGQRPFSWRLFALLSLGIFVAIVGMFVYQVRTENPPPTPERSDPLAKDAGQSVEDIHEDAWRRIQPRLKEADRETQESTDRLVQKIEAFFDSRKNGTNEFAEAALGWGSKWELIKSRDGHRKFLTKQFATYIFSEDELAALLKEATTEYAQAAKATENELLVAIRADIGDLAPGALPAFASQQMLATEFNRLLAETASDIAKDLKIDTGREVGELISDGVIAAIVTRTVMAVATRLGVSAAILTTGTVSTTVTVGAGLVIAIAIDRVLDWIIGWFRDPVGDLSAKVTASLDEVKVAITSGPPDLWAEYDRLVEMAKSDPDPAVKARAAEVVANVERGGALGLKHALGRLSDVHRRARELALRQLVFGASK